MQDSQVAALVAAASQVLLALLGVDYYAMLWAFFGSLCALTQLNTKKKMGRGRAVAYILLSTIAGACLGTMFADWVESTRRTTLIFGSLIGGAGAQIFVGALVQAALNRIQTLGGPQHESP